MNNLKRIFIIADHGLALVYFLQTGIQELLFRSGVDVVLFTEDSTGRSGS